MQFAHFSRILSLLSRTSSGFHCSYMYHRRLFAAPESKRSEARTCQFFPVCHTQTPSLLVIM